MSAKRFLVTGGTGFIGSSLVRHLVEAGNSVRVLDNDQRGSVERLGDIQDAFEWCKGDIRDPEVVRTACKGIDSVCHLAYVNGTEYFYSQPARVLDVGVKGVMNVLDGCIAEDVGELVLASSSEVYQTPPTVPTDETVPLSVPDPLNPRYSYGGGKIISELLALNYGREFFERVLVFRPHNVFGPEMGWEHVIPQFVLRMKALAEESDGVVDFPIQGSGEETRSFIYIDDFSRGLMDVIARGEHMNIYHIGSAEEMSIRQVAEAVGQVFDRTIRIVPGEAPAGATPRRCPDISKLLGLGYDPSGSFESGLRKTAEWYVANAHKALKKG